MKLLLISILAGFSTLCAADPTSTELTAHLQNGRFTETVCRQHPELCQLAGGGCDGRTPEYDLTCGNLNFQTCTSYPMDAYCMWR
jgi:hypothetical protein